MQQIIRHLRVQQLSSSAVTSASASIRAAHALAVDNDSNDRPRVTPPTPATTNEPPHERWVERFRPTFKALLIDAAGTLLVPSEPAAEVYLRYGKKHGITNFTETEVLHRFREAYSHPWGTVRYVGDGRQFWRFVVSHATGSDNNDLFEDIYQYYSRGEAWYVSPGAVDALHRIRHRGIKTAVVSNFDSRLRPIMKDLGITELFDTLAISCEVGVEKPNPRLFETALEALGVKPEEAVHLGDDRRNDVYGARDAGCYAWLYGADVHNFPELERRLETGNLYDSLSGV